MEAMDSCLPKKQGVRIAEEEKRKRKDRLPHFRAKRRSDANANLTVKTRWAFHSTDEKATP